MIYVKIKTKGFRFIIPVPYVFLNIAITVVSSNLFHKNLNKWTKNHFERKEIDFIFPLIDKKTLKPILKELKNYKGIQLVDMKAKDGTEVKVKL